MGRSPQRRAARAPRRCRASHPAQVLHGGAGPGHDDQIGVGDLLRNDAKRTITPGSAASGSRSVRLLERGRRTTATRNVSSPSGCPGSRIGGGVGAVLLVDPEVLDIGKHSEAWAARQASEHRQARLEERSVPPEPVHDESLYVPLILVVEQGESAHQRGEHPTPVDVADHDDRRTRRPGRTRGSRCRRRGG